MSAAFGFLLPALQLDNHRGPYNLKEKALGNVLIQVGGQAQGKEQECRCVVIMFSFAPLPSPHPSLHLGSSAQQ